MEVTMAQATAISPQALIDVAKGLILGYNDRDWAKLKGAITPDFVLDEVATSRKVTGADPTLEIWKAWAQAFPDSKGSIQGARATTDGAVLLELTWKGTHKGTLQTPGGAIPATGRPIEVRSSAVFEFTAERARTQRHYFDMATLLRQIGVNG
jgi:steroid delta-isomerase-like uncharacterized protein